MFRDGFGCELSVPPGCCEELRINPKNKDPNEAAERATADEFVVHKERSGKFYSAFEKSQVHSKESDNTRESQ
jgi:hypothetical protein